MKTPLSQDKLNYLHILAFAIFGCSVICYREILNFKSKISLFIFTFNTNNKSVKA